VLLYDGSCGFCDAYVQLVLRHDRKQSLKFAALQSDFGRRIVQRHPALASVDSVVWFEPGSPGHEETALTKSDAILRVTGYLGGRWTLALSARIVPRFIRDQVYDLVARHRHHLPGLRQQCVIPPPESRARFLDR
jgi:predicted DCC family thiol-disulfide oxidoreductase YuxK